MDNLIGKKLDGLYEVRELIGSGGMANVYKAVMLGHNGPVPAGTVVAVKVLRQEYMHDPDLVRRFKNESKAISLLNHPNIVKVYDVSVNDHLQYIVMEYVDGMTLRENLNARGGKLSSREPRQRCGAPGHQASEHHAFGQRPAAHDGFWHCAHLPCREPAAERQGHGQRALYQPGAGQGR